ncbi:PTS sugar transporter subunit IIA [Enterocloster lavalensis]|uniref:PTS sugar transporter subunit IIA n=1 Tax=Enterocloster lavalensis TaxID=460384 RepID=UPI000D1BBA2B|nr:PTS sorbitol transporter subunit IIB [Enterocloster lavalensis]PST32850.1 PTS sorbitol transporter subunit IIB [Enterocloster lavalensis]
MRRFVIASHHRMARGLKETLEFLTSRPDIVDISAYVDERDLDGQIREAFAGFGPEDEVVIMTDMLGGSVNQKFCQYMSDRCHLICGVNLPCALSLVLQPEDVPLTREAVRSVVEEAKNHLIYVNEYETGENQDDE